MYEILFIYIYMYIYIYTYCAFVGLDNKLYSMHGTYIKIRALFIVVAKCHEKIYFVISINKASCFWPP